MGTAAWRFAFSWISKKRLSGLQALQGSDFDGKVVFVFCPWEFWQLCAPNTWIRSSEVGEANNQCPTIAECLFFHMSMAFVSFAPLCCWWWVVGNCDFNVFGANDVGNSAPLADCNGNHPWLLFIVMNDISNHISRTSMIFKRKSWKINDAPCEIYANHWFS